MSQKGKILVTGGAGYIGSHTIIEILENTEFEVISVDNYSNSDNSTYKRIKEITGKDVINYEVNLCDFDKCKDIFKKETEIIGIIHFAALKAVGESIEKPGLYYRNNLGSLQNLIECCGEFRINNFIFSSSCTVYGNTKVLPVNELSPLGSPECPYATTKFIGEQILQDLCTYNSEFRAVLLRYFNPVGAHVSGLIGENPINKPANLVPIITQSTIGRLPQFEVYGDDYETRDGTCIRDYIHVSDIANAHVLAIQYLLDNKNTTQADIFNLGSGTGSTVLEVIKAFEAINDQKANYRIGPRRPGDVVEIYANNEKAIKELGWSPRYSLEDMMKTAWEWEKNISQGIKDSN